MRILTYIRSLAVVACVGALGCSSSDRDQGTARHGPATGSAYYVLITVGGRPLETREQAQASCREIPFVSWYVLEADRWRTTDSVFTDCDKPLHDRRAVARTGEGTLSTLRDTITFSVSDTTIGVRGVVGRGMVQGDTLTVWESDLDGGDHVYVKRGLAGDQSKR